ncbi:MAG: efflux RND transporter permease subunit [Candidatus Cloacimonetes bacterium]|nr:efflux RND transporter permease subunit [Candidatus Cloacimonadota bacterium]
MSLAQFSVKNPTLINMIMIITFVAGIFAMVMMPKEEMPAIEMGRFIITVSYRGVSPTEMETLVVKNIEDEISDVDDIDYIESTSKEGFATIMVVMEADADLDQSWNDLNTELDKVNNLPADADDPQMIRINMREMNEICNIVLSGDFSDNALRDMSEDFRDQLLEVDHVSKVKLAGTREREIWVEAIPEKLEQTGITLNEISSAIRTRNNNIPGGTITYGKQDFIMRCIGQYSSVEAIGNTVLRGSAQGGRILLKDVATITDTLEERKTLGKLNGTAGVTMRVYKKAEGNIITVMEDIREQAAAFEKNITGLHIEVRNDGSLDVKKSIYSLGNNMLLGIIFVFVLLLIFLGWKNALFAAWGIPFSFLLTLFIMNQFDITINNLSLFGMILVLGMIVDDAIIVLENVHRHREAGLPLKEAVIQGSQEITLPVIAAVLTTISAFLPLMFLSGGMGKFLGIFPKVVAIALAASLIESLLILPSHIAELGGQSKKKRGKKAESRITVWLQGHYENAAQWALGHRKTIMLGLSVLFIISIGILGMGLVKFEFFPSRASSTIVLNIKAPSGYRLENTNALVEKIEDHIASMPESVDVEAVVTNVGQLKERHQNQVESNYAEINIDLLDKDDMHYTHNDIRNSIRQFIDQLPGVSSYAFKEGSHGGAPRAEDIELRVKGEDFNTLAAIDVYLNEKLSAIPGITDIESDLQAGKNEIQILPHYDLLKNYGISQSQIASMVSTAAYGQTVSTYRGSGMDEFDIILKVKEDRVETLQDIQNLKITAINGDNIPLKELADFVITKGYSQINHYNQKRVMKVTASTTTYNNNGRMETLTPSEATSLLKGSGITNQDGALSDFSTRYPGYTLEFGGSAEQQAETYNSLYLALLIALLLIFTILATQFKSYVQPLIVMITIPFSLIGVILGLLITGLPFSVMTLIAVVALAGIVVNDSLVLVDFVNKERDRGTDRWNSLINAGSTRLRPILMTTVTTIGGFLPMILSSSSATEDYKPLAVAIAFGLAFATTLTLFVIPVLYSYVDSFFGRLKLTRFRTHLSFNDAMIIREKQRIKESNEPTT